ncbi:ABC transporter ATP-binding protein [Burkholderia sp. Leaf177]|uniref:ABC transporter ATP-binding protein n=1 Tax=Burkholderia sp. Leaf177 TaxID=1736287 RepID=UPI0006FCE1EA|nr:ABC transporter ATP-binding protein [Burkholderia sp. Leaf177]KQR86037.1 ABC transporter ATP-binding protein [Burkholderia sp. Leaf177]
MTVALELVHVTKRFDATEILRGVDLSIPQGERHALIGPNGAGKSTLFDLISGRVKATSGVIRVNEIDVTGMPSHRLSRAGLARSFQSTRLFAGLTVFDNIRCAVLGSRKASFRDRWVRSASIDREVEGVLDSMGLSARRDELAASLSYAEQRALDLGIALSTGADVLLLDEPTAGMNRAEAERALGLIHETTQGKTLLIVEHDMQAVFALADRISVLVRGRVIATGSAAEIKANALVRAAYLGDVP